MTVEETKFTESYDGDDKETRTEQIELSDGTTMYLTRIFETFWDTPEYPNAYFRKQTGAEIKLVTRVQTKQES